MNQPGKRCDPDIGR